MQRAVVHRLTQRTSTQSWGIDRRICAAASRRTPPTRNLRKTNDLMVQFDTAALHHSGSVLATNTKRFRVAWSSMLMLCIHWTVVKAVSTSS